MGYCSYIVYFFIICSGDRYHNALDKSEYMQFENIGSLALLYIYHEKIIGSICNTWSSIMRIKHIK